MNVTSTFTQTLKLESLHQKPNKFVSKTWTYIFDFKVNGQGHIKVMKVYNTLSRDTPKCQICYAVEEQKGKFMLKEL